MKILGVDLGVKRVGLAVADSATRFAYPLKTLRREGKDAFFAELCAVAQSEGIALVVVGLPLAMDGSETMSSRQARNFAQRLTRRGLTVRLVDERLSTVAAREDLLAAGVKRTRLDAAIDQQAAVRILQTYFSSAAHDGD